MHSNGMFQQGIPNKRTKDKTSIVALKLSPYDTTVRNQDMNQSRSSSTAWKMQNWHKEGM